MKSLMVSLALVLGFSAPAMALQTEINETLPHVLVDGKEMGQVGILKIDFEKKEIQLEIYNDLCGQLLPTKPGQFKCLAAATLENTLTVPLLDSGVDCGSQVYTGHKDDTPVDGLLQVIQVTDHSTRNCKDIVESKLMVKATSFNPWTQTTTTYLLKK